jgi:hypothetical protein
MKANPEIDLKAYELAKNYLPDLEIPGVTQAVIEKYQNEPSGMRKLASKEELYQHLLEAAQNTGMKPVVIGKAIDGVDKLAPVLHNFNPKKVLDEYGDDWQLVLDRIIHELKPKGQIRMTSRSIWPHYCQTILSAAQFIEQFASADDFFRWIDFFNQDDRARASLPMLLDHEIDGFGFALSCDFLKRLGYANFPKPDVHLHDIFTALELCQADDDDYQLFKAIIRLARNANVTPYAADKTFWLIGSGYFYSDPMIGSSGRIGNHKQDFIEFARKKLFEDEI